jgi:membrane protein implicated in regulation of membrane protease activity
MGTASLICGIVGFLGLLIAGPRFYFLIVGSGLLDAVPNGELYYLKCLLIFSTILSILAVIFGIFGYARYKEKGDTSQAGISMGIIGLTLVFIFMFIKIIML